MPRIVLLVDYKQFFGSKQKSVIYRGGMDIPKLIKLFQARNYNAKAINFSSINYDEIKNDNPIVLYTSSEDQTGFYKSFIENIIFHLQDSGIRVVPNFTYLQVHNNKVAMELLRQRSDYLLIKTIQSKMFGTIDELKHNIKNFSFPVVIKSAAGAMSRGVARAENTDELIEIAKRIARSRNLPHDLKELLRKLKYRKNYVRESFYRNKFIIQNYIPNLDNDWKVLVYGNRCYALYRGNRTHDFRASGSGKFIFKKEIPPGLLDYAVGIKRYFNVPHISLDIGYDGRQFHLIEFQFLYFGTTTLEKSPFYFELKNDQWLIREEKSDLEDVYVQSVVDFLDCQ